MLIAGCAATFITPEASTIDATIDAAATPAPWVQIEPTPVPVDLTQLNTEEQLRAVVVPTRDLRDLALRLKPGVDEIPRIATEEPVLYDVGDTLDFWAHDVSTNQAFQVTAELIHMTDVAYAWVEVGREHDAGKIARSVDHFSEVAYPAEVAFFGSEWNPGIDGDPRLHILHATNLGNGIAGYFSSADQYSRLANEYSNEKEMFYINLDWLNRSGDYEYYETVLAHEFQHMVHWYNDRNEETWLNEGLSEFAQEVAGYDPDLIFARAFINEPDTQLNTWNDSNKSNSTHYGSAYLFVSYFAQRFGPELTRALVAHPANGAAGVSAVLAEAGYELTFEDVFADWVIANFVDDAAETIGDGYGTGRFGYLSVDPGKPEVDLSVSRLPLETTTSTVNNYAVDYIELDLNGDVTVEFQGQTGTRLAGTEPYSGRFAWWSNRGDDSNTRLTRKFDFRTVTPGTPIEAVIQSWWEIEDDYDYAYALASLDGEHWTILPGIRTTLDNPSGNSFGAAFTGSSGGWVEERFDLSNYAGEEAYLRFEYVTDDAVNKAGWFIDDIAVPAIGYSTDFEDGPDGWESQGWLLTDNRLEQHWLLQLLEFTGRDLVDVRQIPVDEAGRARVELADLGWRDSAVLAVTAFAPITTEPAEYTISASRPE